MKSFFGAVIGLSLCASTAIAQSSKSETVACPIIASRSGGTYQAPSKRDFMCFRSTRDARTRGFQKGNILSSGSVTGQSYFSLQGVGSAVTPVFQVTRSSAIVDFNYTGTGSFSIELVDQVTGRTYDKIASNRGSVRGTTYVNTSGTWFLRVNGDNARARDTDPEPSWFVSLDSGL